MGEPTGVLTIKKGDVKETYSWNGDVQDRAAARNAFDAMMAQGGVLAVAFTSPGKGKKVSSFSEIEEIERETGVVSAQITTGLVGG